jgi:inorganic pyrophosphatase
MPQDADVVVLIEIPKGSRNKYELNPETGRMRLDRRLWASVSYPVEYGLVPGTEAQDGGELDALVLSTEATFPGCEVLVRPIGLLEMRMGDDGPANPKLVCVPDGDPSWEGLEDAADLPSELREEIAHFFEVYKDLEGGSEVGDWGGREAALELLREARERA